MLDTYLEYRVQKKLQLFHILQLDESVHLEKIKESMNVKETIAKNLLLDLERDFSGFAKIKKNGYDFSLTLNPNTNVIQLLHCIYKNSIILQCLQFLINNRLGKPYSKFSEKSFYSTASIYRVKKICRDYLNSIGLDIRNNQIVGEEYRIRYLIALLHYKYGILSPLIDRASIKIARNFILATNQSIHSAFLETTSNEYGYFECLLILAWKRKQYSPFYTIPDELKELDQLFVHRRLPDCLKEHLELPLHITFSEADYYYIFLSYCTTSNCLFADQWTIEDFEYILRILFEDPKFFDLLKKLENAFGKTVMETRAALIVLANFAKKFICNLQCIIPDKDFHLFHQKNTMDLKVYHYTQKLIDGWVVENKLPYPISPAHIRHLALQGESILRRFLNPVQVVLITDLFTEKAIMKLLLEREFSSHKIVITEFALNSDPTDSLKQFQNCVMILNRKFQKIADFLELSKNNIVVPITIQFTTGDITSIYKAIGYYEEKNLIEMIERAVT